MNLRPVLASASVLVLCGGLAFSQAKLTGVTKGGGSFAAAGPCDPLTVPGDLYGVGTGLFGAAGTGFSESFLYKIDPATGAYCVIGTTTFFGVTGLATLKDGRMVASAFDFTVGSALIEIDRATGAGLLLGPFGDSCLANPDLTYDPITDTLYATGSLGCGITGLYTVDQTTGAATPVGAGTGYFGSGYGLAWDPKPVPFSTTLYATPSDFGSLVIIDEVTGVGADVPGSAGLIPSRVSALAFDHESLDLYGSHMDAASGSTFLVTIDKLTGTTTTIGPTVDTLDAIVFDNLYPTGSCVFRNGSGVNPVGFDCVNSPLVGQTWDSTVDTTPLFDSTTATLVALGLGGPSPGYTVFAFEGLILPPILVLDTALGSHSIPIPPLPGLIGDPISTQAGRLELSGGTPVFVPMNAQDLVLGV